MDTLGYNVKSSQQLKNCSHCTQSANFIPAPAGTGNNGNFDSLVRVLWAVKW